MPVNLSQVQNLNVGICEVTLTSPDEANTLTFDVKYNKNVPTELFICMADLALIGKQLTATGELMELAAKNEVSGAKANELQNNINEIKGRLSQLPSLLSRVVLWQDVEGAEHPDEMFFATTLGTEKCVEYAVCIIAAKQRPTSDSKPTLPQQSIQVESVESTITKPDASGLPDGLVEAQAGATTTAT